jgi:hypothetical protein
MSGLNQANDILHQKGVFMKKTIPLLIVMAIGLLCGCARRDINLGIDYSWSDDGSILTINYTLINSGLQNLENVVVTFGADLTTGGNNYYGDPEDLSISTSHGIFLTVESKHGSLTIDT